MFSGQWTVKETSLLCEHMRKCRGFPIHLEKDVDAIGEWHGIACASFLSIDDTMRNHLTPD